MAGNPLRSEAAAFHWVLGTLAVAVVLVLASWISTWLGLAVVVALLAAALGWFLTSLRRRRRRPLAQDQERAKVEDTPGP